MKVAVVIGEPHFVPQEDGEQLTNYSNSILNSLMSDSVNRTLHLEFSAANQQKIAEEIGYRRALLDFLTFFSSQENT